MNQPKDKVKPSSCFFPCWGMHYNKESALVIFSGGQDSTTCLFWALQVFKEVVAISFNYGQKHSIELESAKKIAELAGVKHVIIDIPAGTLISMSPLTNPGAELEQYENYQQMNDVIGDRREKTFVPMRNALFLTIAANHGEVLGIKNLVTGVCEQDGANYDDTREVFIRSTQDYINKALGHDHRGTSKFIIHTPLINLSKADTVRLARTLPKCWEALALSHTSYDGKYPPTDKNHSNLLRAEGFREAGFPDPLVVRAWNEGLMGLPETENYDNLRHFIRHPVQL